MGISFNSKGHCLINKQTGIKITENIKNELKQLKSIKFPQKTQSYDIVEIGHNFKPEENSTKILTFRDKKGKILQRNIISKTPESTKEIQRNYITFRPQWVSYNDNTGSCSNLVRGRKISEIQKQNGYYHSKLEEIQTWTRDENGEQLVTISKIKNSPTHISSIEKEQKSLYEYSRQGKKGYSTNEYARTKFIGIDLNDIKFNFENINPIENDKHLPLHLYSFKNFRNTAPYIIENSEHKPPMTDIYWYKKQPKNGKISYGYIEAGNIYLNKKAMKDRVDVVQTVAHEKEHIYQKEQRVRQNLLDRLEQNLAVKYKNKPITLRDITDIETKTGKKFVDSTEEAKKYIEAYKNYDSSLENFEEYRNNYLELKAEEAALKAELEYYNSIINLKSIFKFAPDYQIGFKL